MRVGWIAMGMILLAALEGEARGGIITGKATEYGYYTNNTSVVPPNPYNTTGLGPTTNFGPTPRTPVNNKATIPYNSGSNGAVYFATISGQTGPIDLVFPVGNQSTGTTTTYTIMLSTTNETDPPVDFDDFEFELGSLGDVDHSNFVLAPTSGPLSFVSGSDILSNVSSSPVQTTNSLVWTNIGVAGDFHEVETISVQIAVPNGISTFTLRSEFFMAPEPATAGLIATGLTILLRRRRSRVVV